MRSASPPLLTLPSALDSACGCRGDLLVPASPTTRRGSSGDTGVEAGDPKVGVCARELPGVWRAEYSGAPGRGDASAWCTRAFDIGESVMLPLPLSTLLSKAEPERGVSLLSSACRWPWPLLGIGERAEPVSGDEAAGDTAMRFSDPPRCGVDDVAAAVGRTPRCFIDCDSGLTFLPAGDPAWECARPRNPPAPDGECGELGAGEGRVAASVAAAADVDLLLLLLSSGSISSAGVKSSRSSEVASSDAWSSDPRRRSPSALASLATAATFGVER